MINQSLRKEIDYLFNRRWDEELSNEKEESLQDIFDNTIENYGWEQVFENIDIYMRSTCLTGESTANFVNLFWEYTCENPRKIFEPYRFLGYLYYKVDFRPWDYDCAEVFDGLVYNFLSGKDDFAHNPFTNYDYKPEEDPYIVAEVEKLSRENI